MKQIYSITLDQHVRLNGITGYVDFIGQDVTIIIDSNNKSHVIENKSIREVYSSQNTHLTDISVLNIGAVHTA